MNLAMPRSAHTFVRAEVSVVLPWSTCPIVPTFTCGLRRSYFAFAILPPCSPPSHRVTALDDVAGTRGHRLPGCSQDLENSIRGLTGLVTRMSHPRSDGLADPGSSFLTT